jgi:hypothetical protein
MPGGRPAAMLPDMTETHASTAPRPVRIPAVVVAIGSAAVVAGGYLLLLGWHQTKQLDVATGTETGPYQPWQVVALVALVGVLAAAGGWFGRPLTATIAVPVTLTAVWVADAVTTPRDDASLWPIGAVLVAVASLAGSAAVAYGAAALRRFSRRGPERRRP